MLEELLKYQEADAGLKKIENILASSEARKKAIVAKKYLESVEESVNKLDVKAEQLVHIYEKTMEEYNAIAEQREEFKGAMEHADDENALTYLLKKVDELQSKIKSLYAEATKISEEIQAVMTEYASIKKKTKAAQEQYSENVKKYGELKASVQEEKSRIEAELSELEKKVDKTLMEKYKAKRKAKIYPVVFPVRGNVCGACNMELPSSVMSQFKNSEIIECDQCGHLLYQEK